MKIGIVGSGTVGSTTAYTLVMRGIGREIVLVDRTPERARAEAYDISHATPFSHPLVVRSGDYADLENSRIVIITAGVPQKPGQSRLDLLKRNAGVLRDIMPRILQSNSQAILVVVTNPVDIMTYVAAHYAAEYGLPDAAVMGSGTLLDTARFRTLIGEHIGVDPQHVHGYVIGEHGDSEVLAWSLVRVGAMTLEGYCTQQGIAMGSDVREDIERRVRRAAYKIIEGKGATYYGIAAALAKIADVVLHDQRSILTISSMNPRKGSLGGVAISMPHLVGGGGVLAPIDLHPDEEEERCLKESAETIRQAIAQLGPDL